MPVRVTSEDAAFLSRVRGYCAAGLSEPEMAAAEEPPTSISSFRNRLLRNGFAISKSTRRELVRTGSGEPIAQVIERGELLVLDGEPVA